MLSNTKDRWRLGLRFSGDSCDFAVLTIVPAGGGKAAEKGPGMASDRRGRLSLQSGISGLQAEWGRPLGLSRPFPASC
jgi:hypothetical protein